MSKEILFEDIQLAIESFIDNGEFVDFETRGKLLKIASDLVLINIGLLADLKSSDYIEGKSNG